jgi:hypothetical protein
MLAKRLQEAQLNLEVVLQEKNDQIQKLRDNSDAEIAVLKERVNVCSLFLSHPPSLLFSPSLLSRPPNSVILNID